MSKMSAVWQSHEALKNILSFSHSLEASFTKMKAYMALDTAQDTAPDTEAMKKETSTTREDMDGAMEVHFKPTI